MGLIHFLTIHTFFKLYLLTMSSVTSVEIESRDIKIYIENIPPEQSLFYDSFIPLIFEFQKPSWNKTDITFNNWYHCDDEENPYWDACPVTFHLNKVIANLHIDFEEFVESGNIVSTEEWLEQKIFGDPEFCIKIGKHFPAEWTSPSDFEYYLKGLKELCGGRGHDPVIERSIPDYNYTIRESFDKIYNNFYQTFYENLMAKNGNKNQSHDHDEIDGILRGQKSNARTSLQGIMMGQYYAEKYRWIHALQDCRQGYIPMSLVTREKLNKTLSQIVQNKNGNLSEFEFTISLDSRNYYNLPVADCTQTGNNFVVRILIPVRKKKSMISAGAALIHVKSIPFSFSDGHICRLRSKGKGDELFLKTSAGVFATNCKSNGLCRISELGDFGDAWKINHCLTTILRRIDDESSFTGNFQDCDFECIPIGSQNFAIFLDDVMKFYEKSSYGQLINLEDLFDAKEIEGQIGKYFLKSEKFLQEHTDSLVDAAGGGGGGYQFFWILFLTAFTFLLSLQVYIIVMLNRQGNKKYSRYEENEKILYKVDQDPDTDSIG